MPPATKAAPAAKKAAPQMTVTLKHLAAALSDSHDLPNANEIGIDIKVCHLGTSKRNKIEHRLFSR